MSTLVKLDAMIGKAHQHKGTNEILHFKGYVIEGDQIAITTNLEVIKTTTFELRNFINDYMPVPGTVTLVQKEKVNLPELKTMQADTITLLRDTLLDNIKKVKEDPAYIPQAKEIGSNINSLINLARTEIEMKTKL